ncbi:hypothetical protein MAUB1S_03690 [Mycolicibacterium aubagnense]
MVTGGGHTIAPRRVSFDWDATPLHWIPDEPTATHVINVLHLLLPAGERWFVKVFKEALPLVQDPVLLKDVKGFMGQEATHSVQHAYVLGHLAAQNLDTTPYTRHVDYLFDVLLGEQPPFGLPVTPREWLGFRLSLIAAIEQFTAVLGNWVLEADGLDRTAPDPVMLDLLRWHGAEEVEHRSVAFDMYEHCGGEDPGRDARRVLGMAVTAPVLFYLWLGRPLPDTQRPTARETDALLAARAQPGRGQGPAAELARAGLGRPALSAAVVPSLEGGVAAQGRGLSGDLTRGTDRGGRDRPRGPLVRSDTLDRAARSSRPARHRPPSRPRPRIPHRGPRPPQRRHGPHHPRLPGPGAAPQPERRGRANVYRDTHLARLHQIAGLLDRGYTLASIKELLDARETAGAWAASSGWSPR